MRVLAVAGAAVVSVLLLVIVGFLLFRGMAVALVIGGIGMVLLARGFQRVHVDGGAGEVTQPVQKLVLHRLSDPVPGGHGYV